MLCTLKFEIMSLFHENVKLGAVGCFLAIFSLFIHFHSTPQFSVCFIVSFAGGVVILACIFPSLGASLSLNSFVRFEASLALPKAAH